MKVRATLMTEDNEHLDDTISDKKLQRLAELGWGVVADTLSNDDKICIVEKVEVVER